MTSPDISPELLLPEINFRGKLPGQQHTTKIGLF